MDESHNVSQDLYPEVGSAYSYGWQVLKKNFWMLLGVIVIGVILGALPNLLNSNHPTDLLPLSSVFWLLVSGPVSYGIYWVFLNAVRNEPFEIKDMFAAFSPNYWNVFVTNVLLAIIIGLGFVFLIIPGIYLACKLAFVPFLVMDKQMKFSDALSTSWNMTKGYGWTIFLMGLLAIPIAIGGLILFGVGVLISSMWITAAFAALYHVVSKNQ